MDPPKIYAAIDYSSTGPRSVWSLASPVQPHFCYIEPDICEVSASSIESYRRKEVGEPQPEDAAWVSREGQHWACGRLARHSFGGAIELRPLKVDLAVYQTLAIVGAIAWRRDLPSTFALDLGVLLPYGEYRDLDGLQARLRAALTRFSFRGREYACALTRFYGSPEGGGLLAWGTPQKVWGATATSAIAAAVLGFRNRSSLLVWSGSRQGETDTLGFSYAMKLVQQSTSGQRFDDPRLMAAASLATPKQRQHALAQLARSQDARDRIAEGERLAAAVEAARQQYFMVLTRRFRDIWPVTPAAIVLGGGTAWSCKDDLRAIFKRLYPQARLEFCLEARRSCQAALGLQLKQRGVSASRVLDAYCYFRQLLASHFRQEEAVAQ